MTRFSEQFTITDLDANAISDLTAKWLFDREHGDGSNSTQLANVNIVNDKMYLHYKSFPTYSSDGKRITLHGTTTPTKWYDTTLEYDDFTESVGDKETFNEFSSMEKSQVMRDYLYSGMVRVFCNCPAFYYQGHHEALDAIDSAIYKFPGPKGTGVWAARHAPGLTQKGISICKHIASTIHRLNRDISKIVNLVYR